MMIFKIVKQNRNLIKKNQFNNQTNKFKNKIKKKNLFRNNKFFLTFSK